MSNKIQLKNVVKNYGNFTALQDITLSIKEGSIFGLIGKNGAGKTTILKILSGMIKKSAGEVFIEGVSVGFGEGEYLKKIGTLIETPAFYDNMAAIDNLKIRQKVKGSHEDLLEILDMVGLKEVAGKKVKGFSLGMRQRAGIAMALVGSPEILILDEPINGLDPQGILEIRELITRLNRDYKMTIIVSSHILEELSKVVDSYAIIDHGKVVKIFDDHDMEQSALSIKVSVDEMDEACRIIEETYGYLPKTENPYIVIPSNIVSSSVLNRELVNHNIMVNELILEKESMEDVYLKVTGKGDELEND